MSNSARAGPGALPAGPEPPTLEEEIAPAPDPSRPEGGKGGVRGEETGEVVTKSWERRRVIWGSVVTAGRKVEREV